MNWIKSHWLMFVTAFAVLFAAVVVLSLPDIDSAGLTAVSVASLMISLMKLAMAIAAVFLILRLLDVALDIDIKKIFEAIENDPEYAANYLGLRFVAVCILTGMVVS